MMGKWRQTLLAQISHLPNVVIQNLQSRVVSIYYGEAEIGLPKAYVEREWNEILKLGLQGHTIFTTSSDYGVASFPGSNGDEYGCLSTTAYMPRTIYSPDYPAGCPYITVVGGNRLYPNDTVHSAESAMQVNVTAYYQTADPGLISSPYDFFATGGGVSNYFKPADFQADAVASYLKQKDLPF